MNPLRFPTSRMVALTAAVSALACGPSDEPSASVDDGLPVQGPAASQTASVTQSIHTTQVSIHYARPVARGRELFGNLVQWDSMWTPGANRATYLETTGDLLVEGHPLPQGSYSLWLQPAVEGPWTLVFSNAWDMYHLPYPEGEDYLRVEVTPETGAHMEALAAYFPVVEGYEATLRLHWGSTIIPVHLAVPSG